MKEFKLSDYAYDQNIQSLIKCFLSPSFKNLSHKTLRDFLNTLDSYVYILTGQPNLKIEVLNGNMISGKYSNNDDEKLDIYVPEENICGVEILTNYFRSKYRQFQRLSVLNGNKDVEEETLNRWKENYYSKEKYQHEYLTFSYASLLKYEQETLQSLLKDYGYDIEDESIKKKLENRIFISNLEVNSIIKKR